MSAPDATRDVTRSGVNSPRRDNESPAALRDMGSYAPRYGVHPARHESRTERQWECQPQFWSNTHVRKSLEGQKLQAENGKIFRKRQYPIHSPMHHTKYQRVHPCAAHDSLMLGIKTRRRVTANVQNTHAHPCSHYTNVHTWSRHVIQPSDTRMRAHRLDMSQTRMLLSSELLMSSS